MRGFSFGVIAFCGAIIISSVNSFAQAPAPAAPPPAPLPMIGGQGVITLEQAKMVAAAAEAEAKKNKWNYAIAIVEPSGALVYFQKMGGTMYGSINVAMDKAASAALFRRPTAAFDAGLRAGNNYLLTLRGANAVPGGLPIVLDGMLVGAMGTSGGSAAEDAQVAQAGVAGLK